MRHPLRIVLAGLLLGLVFDRLVVTQPLGISFPLFVALVVLALALTMKWEAARPLRRLVQTARSRSIALPADFAFGFVPNIEKVFLQQLFDNGLW